MMILIIERRQSVTEQSAQEEPRQGVTEEAHRHKCSSPGRRRSRRKARRDQGTRERGEEAEEKEEELLKCASVTLFSSPTARAAPWERLTARLPSKKIDYYMTIIDY